MKNSPLFMFDLILFLVEFVLAISSFYSAWINLIQKEISKIGFDAFVILFFKKNTAMMIRKSPKLIMRMGIISLLVAIGSANEAISIFLEKIWPNFH